MRSGDAGIDRFPVRRCHRQYGTGKVRVPDLPIGKVTVTVNEAVPTQYVVHDIPAKNPSDLQYLTHGNAAASRSMLERRNSMVGLRPPKTKARAEGGRGREGRRRGFIFVFTRLSQRHQCGTKWQVKHNAAEQRDPSFQSWIRRRPMHVHVQYVGHGSPPSKKKKV